MKHHHTHKKAHWTSNPFPKRRMHHNNYKFQKVTCLYIPPNLFLRTYHVFKSLVEWPWGGEREKEGSHEA